MFKKIIKIGVFFSAGLILGTNLGNAQSGAGSNTCRGSCWVYDANGTKTFFRSFTCLNIYNDGPNTCFWASLDECALPSGLPGCSVGENTNCSRIDLTCLASGISPVQ